jgi:hypothetical protein
MITKEQFESGYTYSEYRDLVRSEFEKGRNTGSEQSESLMEYTDLNLHRMKRLDKTIELDAGLKKKLAELPCSVKWLVLAEGWCGDASQNLPIMNKMAEASTNIELRILLRDEHLDVMDQYLTNGARAIPKLIIMDGDMNQIGTWGPRPSVVQEMVMENKRIGKVSYSEFSKVVQKWYATDKGKTLEMEMMTILNQMECAIR